MKTIESLFFYRTGEVTRDIGLIYFYKILKEIKENIYPNIEIELSSNYLKIEGFESNIFYDYIINTKIYHIFLKGIKEQFKNKIDVSLLENIKIDNFIDKIRDIEGLKDIDIKGIEKRFSSKYFPYVRNSGKYGVNSGGEENFHKNLKKIIELMAELNVKNDEERKQLLKEYEPMDNKCIICHEYYPTKLDITHKNEKKERKNSKYNYLFMGAEKNNTFNNYGKSESSICFVCEFMNLMTLLYISLEKPSILAYTDDLKSLEFINHKLMVRASEFNEKSLYKKLSKFRDVKIRTYDIITDSNKGIIIKFGNILKIRNLITNLKLYDIVENYNYSRETAIKMSLCKKFIRSNNLLAMQMILLNDLLVIVDKESKHDLKVRDTIDNIKSYLKLLDFKCEEGNLKVDDRSFTMLGIELGKRLNEDDKNSSSIKKTIAFRLNQMLKSDNRQAIFESLMHLIINNGISIPKNFSWIVMKSKTDELHYCIGKFFEGFLNSNFIGEDK